MTRPTIDGERVLVGDSVVGAVRPGEPVVVFIHGLAGHHGEWSPVIKRLAKRVGAVAADLAGHGAHPQQWSERASYEADVVALIEASGAGQVVLVGQSMGGIVALQVAADRPDLVSALVLVEAGIEMMTTEALDGLRRWFASWPDRFVDREDAAQFFGPTAPSTPAWIDGLHAGTNGLTARFDADDLMQCMATIATSDRGAVWRSLQMPSTLVIGQQGTLASADVARMQALRPASVVEVVDNAGHDVHLDRPSDVAAAIMRGIDLI